ncbi:hypothetical protein DPMN_114493 [Dreissena polymorpha]|uniref:Uncharacterized protein n=1 Tax=Dreissena polymorpha TaxID=45954 RepID=A0A9D4QRS5_DREPO|nr:hypothetical protein DPMN_114493 [Dreissena polymorpha]
MASPNIEYSAGPRIALRILGCVHSALPTEVPVVVQKDQPKNAPPLGSHVFQANIIIFELFQDIIETNLLTIFHEDWTMNVASRVLTRLLTRKNAPPRGGHVFQPTSTIFELVQDIIGMNLLTEKNTPPLGSHVFQANVIIFELIQDNNKTNLLTIFHEDWTINEKCPAPWGPYIIGTNLLTKFHESENK